MREANWSWSHSLKNYVLMFDLNMSDFSYPILDIAAGASTFNFEMHRLGYQVISSDPFYHTAPDKITAETKALIKNLIAYVKQQHEQFHWGEECRNPEELERQQLAMADIFIRDFAPGLSENRYTTDAFPVLAFENFQFNFALCANFIFDGPYHDDFNFQLQAIHEMARIAKEARIYPLLGPDGNISPHLGVILAHLQTEGYGVEIRQVPYQFLKNGNSMLRVFAKNSSL